MLEIGTLITATFSPLKGVRGMLDNGYKFTHNHLVYNSFFLYLQSADCGKQIAKSYKKNKKSGKVFTK